MSVTVVYSTQALASGGRTGRIRSADGRLEATLSTPRELGGEGGDGTSPEQLFAGGFAASFLRAMKAAATAEGMPRVPADASVTVHVGLGPSDRGGLVMTVDLAVSLPGLERQEADRLIRAARAVCPYTHAIHGNVDVRLTIL